MIYAITISLSVLFAWCSGISKGISKQIFLFLAILLPAIIWGVRSTLMGVDVQLYAEPIWNMSQNLTKFDYTHTQFENSIEKGYLVLNFLLSRVFKDIHWLFFILSFISCFSVLYTFTKSEYSKKAWLGYAFYLLIFFPTTINLVRQGFAMSLLVPAYLALFYKKWKSFFAFVIIAALFHNSALIALSFPLIYLVLKNKDGRIRQYILAIILLVGTFGWQFITPYILLINDKYEIYLNNTFKPHFTIFSLVNVPFIIFFLKKYRTFKKKCDYFSLEVFFLIAGTITSQLGWIAAVYMARVALPYNYFILFAPMMLMQWIKQEKNDWTSKFFQFGLALFATTYFFLWFYINGVDCVFPYKSEILDQLLE